jgi:hypothetical protein
VGSVRLSETRRAVSGRKRPEKVGDGGPGWSRRVGRLRKEGQRRELAAGSLARPPVVR